VSGSPWSDLDSFVATPRLGGLVLAPDGRTLLVAVSAPDKDGTAYQSAWWSVDVTGREPARRWTRSVEGESAAAFTADGSLLFTSKRPAPPGKPGETQESASTSVLWCLPAGGGEAYPLARRVGGWSGVVTARDSGRILLAATAHVASADEAGHAAISEDREQHKISAILHEGYPVRYWDHDLGASDVRLLTLDLDTVRDEHGDADPTEEAFVDVTPTRGCTSGELRGLDAGGRVAVLDWTEPDPGGSRRTVVVLADLGTGAHEVLARDEVDDFSTAVISPDGTLVACVREVAATAERAVVQQLWLFDRAAGTAERLAADWDAWPSPHAISPDRSTVYVTVDERGHRPLYAVDVATGSRRRLTGAGAVTGVVLSSDGGTLYAVRSSYTDPGTVVAVDTGSGTVRELRGPVAYPELPGTCEEVAATADDGTEIRGYLLRPESSDGPAPLALWMHGGPLSSWNAWSWRWCPWLLVARGYAVLLPDPALSTGYGQDFVQRGWGRWGGPPYDDLMAVTDAVVARDDVDETRTVAMGGSFGGYLANWVAGHTDRFAAIVSHASLWNLETFGPTTDAAWYWSREMSPEMMRENSPHRYADRITTPMLVIHGDKDYRVPISEGLALWWALVSGHDGAPEELPHKFLYFPDENHWVLTPQHAKLWYDTVLAFLDTQLNGVPFRRPHGV
jgi:dipeptidyl aminopeptidase/acylaminoacyl peptidase